jgi:hypothetical protein
MLDAKIVAVSTHGADRCRSVRRMVISRSHDLRTIALLREVPMSIEAIVPAISRSFVYEGCYRPRGSLTFAERSAWGLRSSGNRPPASNSSTSAPEAAVSTRRSTPVTSAQFRPHEGTHKAHAIENKMKRKPRVRVGCLTSAAVRYAKRFASAQHLAKPRRFSGWYRLSVKVGCGSATCLLVRGRSFVAGDMRAKTGAR